MAPRRRRSVTDRPKRKSKSPRVRLAKGDVEPDSTAAQSLSVGRAWLSAQQAKSPHTLAVARLHRDALQNVLKSVPKPSDPVDAAWLQAFERTARRLAEPSADLPHQDSAMFGILSGMVAEVETVAVALGFPRLPATVIGTLDENSLNAFNASFFGTTSVIVVQRRMMLFVHLLMKAVCLCTIVLEPKKLVLGRRPEAEQFAEGIGRLRELASAIRTDGGIGSIPPNLSPPGWPLMPAAAQLLHSIELFIVAHEYGHLLMARGVRLFDPESNAPTLDEEHEADFFALLVVLKTVDPKNPVLHALAPLVFFRMLQLMENASLLPTPRNHPSSAERFEFLLQILTLLLSKGQPKQVLKLWKIWSPSLEAAWREANR